MDREGVVLPKPMKTRIVAPVRNEEVSIPMMLKTAT